MKIEIETRGMPSVFYDTETKKYSCFCCITVDGKTKSLTIIEGE